MSTINNSKLRSRFTPDASADLGVDRQITDISLLPALSSGDSVQIGVVPAGCVLVPQLCTIQVPVLDTSGSPTVKYKIGSVASAAALAAEKTPGAAVSVVAASAFVLGTQFGSATDDTPIYLNLSAAVAAQAVSGKILFDVAMRAYDSELDS